MENEKQGKPANTDLPRNDH